MRVPCFLMSVLFCFSFIWVHVYAFAIKSMVHWGIASARRFQASLFAHHLWPFLTYWECQLCGGKTSKSFGLISFLNNVWLIIMIGAALRWKLRCQKWINFETKSSGVHIHLQWNLCSKAYIMLDLSSIVPALRFAAITGYYVTMICYPKEIFYKKSSGQNPPLSPTGEPLLWDSQCARGWKQTRILQSFGTKKKCWGS